MEMLKRNPDGSARGWSLSGNQLKTLAAVFMFIDHFAKVVLVSLMHNIIHPMEAGGALPEGTELALSNLSRQILVPIGAVAFPIFCYLFVEGFLHTHNRKRYFLKLTVFALLSEIPFDITFFGSFAKMEGTYPFIWGYQNVLFTFMQGFVTLWIMEWLEKKWSGWPRWLLQAITAIVACGLNDLVFHADYEGGGIALIVIIWLLRRSKLHQMIGMLGLKLMQDNGQHPRPFLAAVALIGLYNGKRGEKNMGCFFYIFYPAHILLLHLLDLWLISMKL